MMFSAIASGLLFVLVNSVLQMFVKAMRPVSLRGLNFTRPEAAEFAVIISDAWQTLVLGAERIRRLVSGAARSYCRGNPTREQGYVEDLRASRVSTALVRHCRPLPP